MDSKSTRIVHDSMGSLSISSEALWGAQTQRAIENFPISPLKMPSAFIQALGHIKAAAAKANQELGLLDANKAKAIIEVSHSILKGEHVDQFPLDVFQTGSGTSLNMNANEVIAELASRCSGLCIHPNDDVNMSQSSNDVIPTAIHVSASIAIYKSLIPALKHLISALKDKSAEIGHITKTGRTHLMDAMPLTFEQELSGWIAQLESTLDRLSQTPLSTQKLALGGTAVGTGINASPEFAPLAIKYLSEQTDIAFEANSNYFEALSSQDAAVFLSGQLKVLAVSLMKIANDLRWMNSGPLSGLSEIRLPPVQPGSSIMPGKVNPVIPEAVVMVCTQVIGNDVTLTLAGQSGNFQLNVMLPLIGYNLLQSIACLSNGMRVLTDKAIKDLSVNESHIQSTLAKNPILVTALNPIIGYELGAQIAKTAYAQGRPLIEVAQEMTNLSTEELKELLNPQTLTKGGIAPPSSSGH